MSCQQIVKSSSILCELSRARAAPETPPPWPEVRARIILPEGPTPWLDYRMYSVLARTIGRVPDSENQTMVRENWRKRWPAERTGARK